MVQSVGAWSTLMSPPLLKPGEGPLRRQNTCFLFIRSGTSSVFLYGKVYNSAHGDASILNKSLVHVNNINVTFGLFKLNTFQSYQSVLHIETAIVISFQQVSGV